MELSEADTVFNRLKAQLESQSKSILSDFPLKAYINYLGQYDELEHYNYVSPEVKSYCTQILGRSTKNVLGTYHQLLMTTLIIESEKNLCEKNFPDDIKGLYFMNFKRIIKEIYQNENKIEYLYDNDKFHKDLAVCRLKLIPVGARKIHHATIPIKTFLFRKSLLQFFEVMVTVTFELGGIKPLYIMHTDTKDPDLLAEFNPAGLKQTYLRVAELLMRNPGVRGIFGGSWFNDPQLEHISPRLSYIREIVVQNGGKCFYRGDSEASVRNAILKSPTRRKLYYEGKYTPADHILIWPRKKLINWANIQLSH